jgi:hypothetical protein
MATEIKSVSFDGADAHALATITELRGSGLCP